MKQEKSVCVGNRNLQIQYEVESLDCLDQWFRIFILYDSTFNLAENLNLKTKFPPIYQSMLVEKLMMIGNQRSAVIHDSRTRSYNNFLSLNLSTDYSYFLTQNLSIIKNWPLYGLMYQ